MRELKQILELWQQLEARAQPAVLATVLRTQGSSYRLPGARLLLSSNGQYAGSISGGCLEEDIVKKAWWLTAQGPILRKYDTTPDGEIDTGGFGLGCNGVIHVLLERVATDEFSVLPVLQAVRQQRRPAIIAHLQSPEECVGERLIMNADGSIQHNVKDPALAERLMAEASFSNFEQNSRMLAISPETEVFLEAISPPTHLLVFGAGHDAVPLTELANNLGWRVSVFDGRGHYARRERFPAAGDVTVRPLGSDAPDIDRWTVAVVMTHSYSQDLDILRTLANQPLRYLGVLGPRKRTGQLMAEAGIGTPRNLDFLYTPMGLDLGGDSPEQVALSVIAEIQASLNKRSGGLLRDRLGPIHASEFPQDEHSTWVRSIVCA